MHRPARQRRILVTERAWGHGRGHVAMIMSVRGSTIGTGAGHCMCAWHGCVRAGGRAPAWPGPCDFLRVSLF